ISRTAVIPSIDSLPHAERGEDAVENVVRASGAGDGIDRPESGVEIQQQHLVGNAGCDSGARLFEVAGGLAQQLLVAQAGDETGLLLESALGSQRLENRFTKLGDAFAGQGGNGDGTKRG